MNVCQPVQKVRLQRFFRVAQLILAAVCLIGIVGMATERHSSIPQKFGLSEPAFIERQESADAARLVEIGDPSKIGKIDSRLIDESSGLAASHQYPGHYWTHNDNGRNPGLFLISESGQLRAHYQLEGVPHRDWEAFDIAQVDQRNLLVLADVGDNGRRHASGRILVMEEPKIDLQSPETIRSDLKPMAKIEFQYPGGPRDCEAMAVDVESGLILLISKQSQQDETATVHSVPWQLSSTDEPLQAELLIENFPRPMVTGMDLSTDGRWLAVRSYSSLWLFHRPVEDANEETAGWKSALEKPVAATLLPIQRQGEAICFAATEQFLIISSEGQNQPLWKIELEFADRKNP